MKRNTVRNIAVAALVALIGITATFGSIGVTVSGNHFFGNRRLQEMLPNDPEKINEETLLTWKEDALFNLADLYRQNGFFDARLGIDLSPDSLSKDGKDWKDWKALLAITEGPRYRYDTVRVVVVGDSGRVAISGEPLRVDPGEFAAKKGEPYQEENLFQDRRLLLKAYGNAGYVRVKAEDQSRVDSAAKTVEVEYRVTPSVPVIYDTLWVQNRRAPPEDSVAGITRVSLFQSLLPYRRGDTVRVSQNDRFIEKLQSTGVFNYVRLKDSLLPGPEHHSALLFSGEERVPGNMRPSFFWDSQYGPGAALDATYGNVSGTLNQVRTGASVSADRQRAYGGFGIPLLFGSLVRFDEDLDINWLQAPPVPASQGMFDGDFLGTNSASLTWPWSYWLRLISDAELAATSRNVTAGRERALDLNFIQTAAMSFLNHPMDPTRGVRTAFIWGNGGPFIEDAEFALSRFRHNWFENQTALYYYYPPIPQVKPALRLNVGRFFGEGGANSTRFFLGGSRSVRSYDFEMLCPEKDSLGNCPTTDLQAAYYLTSFELRIGLFDFGYINPRRFLRFLIPLEVVPFYDFGKVWDTRRGFSFSSQLDGQGRAYGLGVRYPLLGIFNFRFDLAYGASGPGTKPYTWVVDLAQAF